MKRIERLARRAGKIAVTEEKTWTVTVIRYAEGQWQQQRLPVMDAIAYDLTIAYVGGQFFRINSDMLKQSETALQPMQPEDVQHDDSIVVMNKREGGAAYEKVAALDAAR